MDKILSEVSVKKAKELSYSEEQRLRSIVNRSGGEFLGIDYTPSLLKIPRENLVLFNHPKTHSTLALPISQVTEQSVRQRLIRGEKTIEKQSSFIGNEVIPELDYLEKVRKIDLNDKEKVILELTNKVTDKGRLKWMADYLSSLTPSAYKYLIDHVRTSGVKVGLGLKIVTTLSSGNTQKAFESLRNARIPFKQNYSNVFNFDRKDDYEDAIEILKMDGVEICELTTLSERQGVLQSCPYCGRSVTDGCPNCGWSTMTEEELFSKDESSNILSETEMPSGEEMEKLIDREKAMEEEQKRKSPKESLSTESFRPASKVLGEKEEVEGRKFSNEVLGERDVCAGTITDEELAQLYLSTREKSPLVATREFLQALTAKGLTAQNIADLLPRINMLKRMLDKNKMGVNALSEEDLEKEKKIKKDLTPPPSYGFIPSLSELDIEKRADVFVLPVDFDSKLGRMGFTREEIARIYTHVSDYMFGGISWEHFLKLIDKRRMNLSEYLLTLRLGKMSEKVEKKSDHPPKGWMIAEILKRRDDPKIYSKYFSTFQSLYEYLFRFGATDQETVDKSLDRLPYDGLYKWYNVFKKLGGAAKKDVEDGKKGVKTIVVDDSDQNSDWIKKVKK